MGVMLWLLGKNSVLEANSTIEFLPQNQSGALMSPHHFQIMLEVMWALR